MPDEEEVGGDLKYLNHNRSNVVECHMKRGKRDLGKVISKRRIDDTIKEGNEKAIMQMLSLNHVIVLSNRHILK